ncbi:cupin domain-containing protein [Qipengyuania flava]|uniref:cupin domain-containing protein n=1 Tax=Qipengyuania flava TaxID=192812 RepID=UPI001C635C4E|nr:cupin domain-containing protein [Qipengyuania flava]QYJ07752.1 cupin domain-containing protein [Qipengyuania flava]
MRINADFDKPAQAHPAAMEWIASPMAGVERKMLDRVGEELARATSLVRYAPGSHFSEHTHSGGEEFLVLEGTFSDQTGDFPAGTYVRNPIGTRHTPHSDPGCVIFVKLHQFAGDDDDQKAVALDTSLVSGVQELHRHGDETVRHVALDDGEALVFDGSEGGAEVLLLDGAAQSAGERFGKWGWLRIPAGQGADVTALGHARFYLKTGHLAAVEAFEPDA